MDLDDFNEEEALPPSSCALCQRSEELTQHHLIPKSRHRKARTRRHFSKDDMRSRMIWICWPCHKNLHRCLTEQEMAETYHSVEALRSHPEVEKFNRWICHKPPGFLPAGM
jgi:heterodisulfide reductase subunit C